MFPSSSCLLGIYDSISDGMDRMKYWRGTSSAAEKGYERDGRRRPGRAATLLPVDYVFDEITPRLTASCHRRHVWCQHGNCYQDNHYLDFLSPSDNRPRVISMALARKRKEMDATEL